ncbi:splicing coactivator subunit srm300, putative [Babesia ovata]|uniref:Splicing coactivator subunit srm300, putative n=1 Tax=Babesia ovata TaxID=189622 RepID=A0A2H6KEG3_9APIC|nr:splicing coactivator subunit srm300, putative [Babesia ovata]GBE61383.1 splicing coactivator subunit srm300, putative [Babesia ovata]
MFNGVGLTTPRGSGTNGYVQKSLATLRPIRIAKGHDQHGVITRPKLRTNPEIALHEKLRALEVKLLELRVQKEGQMTTEELDKLIANERQRLMKLLEQDEMTYDRRENDSNQLAEEKARRNQKMMEALNIKHSADEAKTRDVESADQGAVRSERDEIARSVGSTPNRSRSRSIDRPKSPSHSTHVRDVERSASRSASRSVTPRSERRHGKKYKRSRRSYSTDSDVSRDSPATRRRRSRRSRSISNSRSRSYYSVSSERDTDRDERRTERSRMRYRERSRRRRSPSRAHRKRRSSGHKSYRSMSRSASSRRYPRRSHSGASHGSSVSRSHTPQYRKRDYGRSKGDRDVVSTRHKAIDKDRSRSRSSRSHSRSDQVERRRSHSSEYSRRHSKRYSSRKHRRNSSSSVSSSRPSHEARRSEPRSGRTRRSKHSGRSRSETPDKSSRSLSHYSDRDEHKDDGSVTDSSMEHSDG